MDVITCFCSTGRAKLLGINPVASMQNIISFVKSSAV